MYVKLKTFILINREPPCGSDHLMQDEIILTLKKGDLTKNDVIFLKERETQDSVLQSEEL